MSGGAVTIQVEGLRELEQALVGIANEAPAIIAKALRDPMQVVLDDAKALVPKRFGLLHDGLRLVVKRASAKRASSAVDALSEVGIKIVNPRTGMVGQHGAELKPRSYWHLVEFGTAHSSAKPYLRPAFDKNTARMISDFKSIARDRIERVVARYARRGRKR